MIGFATFDSFRQHPAYKYTIENSIYVHKDYRQEGIGKKLLEEIITLANERKYATMVAGIDSENYGSIILHEKLGFKFAGIIKKAGYKFEKWLDLAFYQLELIGPDEPIEEEKFIVK
ncbi:MAG: GNAT family N-acetyltransferase [Eubacteriaceae bacterium]